MFDIGIPSLSASVLGTALLIFTLRVTDVSMGTVRTIMITRGMRKWATLIGFVEVTIWVVAISQVITNLDNVLTVLAYSGGFAIGTMLGMWIESKMALGHVEVHIISPTKGAEVAAKIRKAGYGATILQALGLEGPVSLINIVVSRKQLPAVLGLVNEIDATSFVTVEDARSVIHGYGKLVK
jgi:uncharacterized protein YebE (UPF0316 family)